jgi:IS30 family transposase
MKAYTHLSILEREMIAKGLYQGKCLSELARIMKRSKSTLSRELRRNQSDSDYSPATSQLLYEQRRLKSKRKKLLEDLHHKAYVQSKIIHESWSPEQLAARLKYEKKSWQISYATIYRAIHCGELDVGKQAIKKHLRHKGKRRKSTSEEEKRGKFVISMPITKRSP